MNNAVCDWPWSLCECCATQPLWRPTHSLAEPRQHNSVTTRHLLTLVTVLAALFVAIGSNGLQGTPLAEAEAKADPPSTEREENLLGVATLGIVVEVGASTFILEQKSLEVSPHDNTMIAVADVHLPIGFAGNHLEVLTADTTQIYVGSRPTILSSLSPGMLVLVAGQPEGDRLRAMVVSDLSTIEPPSEEELRQSLIQSQNRMPQVIPEFPAVPEVTASPLSLCLGQDMDYGSPYVKEFQGCYGGPSVSGSTPTGNWPIATIPIVGGIYVRDVSWTFALAGWGFDFPYEFSALPSTELRYHAPSSVSLNVRPLEATESDLTFWGGLGFDFGLDIDFRICAIFWCSYVHFYTAHVSVLSTIHQATGAAPMPGQTLSIEEVACPEVGVKIPETPIDLLTLAVCEDLSLQGAPFGAHVTAEGNTTLVDRDIEFDGSSKTLDLIPDGRFVDVRFDKFWWVPDISVGAYFQLQLFGQVPFFTSPTIPITRGPYMAITTPFPYPDSFMGVATDPLSPVDDPRYLYQPTEVVFRLSVPGWCAGDCGGDGVVNIAELITGVNMALGKQPMTVCPEFDTNDDHRCSINELIAAVKNAVNGCLPEPTTPTVTPTPNQTPTPTGTGRFRDNGDGTVTDNQTGLMWEKKTTDGSVHDVEKMYSWSSSGTAFDGSAKTGFLDKLNDVAGGGTRCFAGHCDWRLPEVNRDGGREELETILLMPFPCSNEDSACIDPIFGPTAYWIYWSATTTAFPSRAWGVSFVDGYLHNSKDKTTSVYARAVRGGAG